MHSDSRTIVSRARVALVTGAATAGLLAASGPATAATAQKRSVVRTHAVAKTRAAAQKTSVARVRTTARRNAKRN